MDKYRREAAEQIPSGFYALKADDLLRADDLVWSVYSKEFLRADSPYWVRSPLKDRIEDIICAIRQIGLSEFEQSIPVKKVFTLGEI
jgi:hypothetical protein